MAFFIIKRVRRESFHFHIIHLQTDFSVVFLLACISDLMIRLAYLLTFSLSAHVCITYSSWSIYYNLANGINSQKLAESAMNGWREGEMRKPMLVTSCYTITRSLLPFNGYINTSSKITKLWVDSFRSWSTEHSLLLKIALFGYFF